jgi:hypothetical protein
MYFIYMGTMPGNLKSKVRPLIESFFPRKGVLKFPAESDYDAVFRNHAVLMNAYGAILYIDSKTFDMFFRSLFVESHIYKKLRSLRKIYLVEIASLSNSSNSSARSKLNKLVEDMDKFSGCLFYFPTIGWREILLYILPTFAAATVVVYHLQELFPESWSQGIDRSAYLTILTALGLTFLVYLGFVALSFVEKRRFFVFPEYKAIRFFDRLQKRWKAFLGRNKEGTIYEKENKLFDSLRMGKEPESPIDIYLFMAIAIIILSILVAQSIITDLQYALSFWLVILPFTLFLALKRKAS